MRADREGTDVPRLPRGQGTGHIVSRQALSRGAKRGWPRRRSGRERAAGHRGPGQYRCRMMAETRCAACASHFA